MADASLTSAQKVKATAVFSDGSTPTDVAWTLDDPSVATFTQDDLLNITVFAVAPGLTFLHVSGGGVSATANITVTAALTVEITFGTPEAK